MIVLRGYQLLQAADGQPHPRTGKLDLKGLPLKKVGKCSFILLRLLRLSLIHTGGSVSVY